MLIDPSFLLQQISSCVVEYAVITFDIDGQITSWNHGAEVIFGYATHEVLATPGDHLFILDDRVAGIAEREMQMALHDDSAFGLRWHQRKDGTLFWADGMMMPMRDNGIAVGFLKILRDVTDTKLAYEKADYLASYDLLTGVANRATFETRLSELLEVAERGSQWLLLFAIDLDRFKEVNDQFGHGTGDTLLKEAAQRLKLACRESDVIARLGGDEFALLQLNPPSVSGGATLAEKLLRELAKPFDIDGHAILISGSIGISVFPTDALSAHDLRTKADLALYQAKKFGRNCYHYFTEKMDHAVKQHNLDKVALRDTVHNNLYRIEYQPIVSAGTGGTVSMEALIRFVHPQLAGYSVDYVINLAQEMGLIATLGTWVFRQACMQLKQWHLDGIENIRVAVNTCAKELLEPAYIRSLEKAFVEFGLEPSQVEIELTERDAIQLNGSNTEILGKLRAMGCLIVLDDFGTGYSSLSYLRTLPIDIIKLDRSFVQEIPQTADANKVASAVISLAHALHIDVTAEGVETTDQADFLQAAHCQCMQGYLFSRSLPPAVATQWLKNGMLEH
jgi:diguanylate cyclase (GGDEF)-like protein/PAS domain S-box-containing protein